MPHSEMPGLASLTVIAVSNAGGRIDVFPGANSEPMVRTKRMWIPEWPEMGPCI